ncbi:hypothetical protein B5V01_03660 [Mesorhizobium erdmanii]|uniref:Transposase n=2 Tax=Mesorhizobium TaxID=68287 RepID=A0A3M9X385_9HYPH|nr:hypothetical protein DNR46_27225 [Mesorhizobium japonicum]RXT51360.1 hypothetical protein B5V01_03660 [Mesorhizobium erdmanii]
MTYASTATKRFTFGSRDFNGLRAQGLHAICIDPRRLRAMTKTMPIKNDRNDARAIAGCSAELASRP